MNRLHRWYCGSPHWRQELERRILPWALSDVELGEDVLEVGPGPGLTTDFLRARLAHLTAIEIDPALAGSLAARLAGANVTVIRGDGAALPFADARFSGVVSFTVLHHVPSRDVQERLLREVRRVLRSGGVFAGVDSRQSLLMRLAHIRDVLVPIDPMTFPARLKAAGFEDVLVQTSAREFRFRARRAVTSEK